MSDVKQRTVEPTSLTDGQGPARQEEQVKPDNSSSDLGAESRPSGPYDVAILVARSFGRSLPAVIIVALIAYGAWFALGEMSVLQTRIIDAERQKSEAVIKKAEAEADAKAAGDRAKYDALQEYSKQLATLNTVSADVSKQLQELVGSQLDNMKKANELTDLQDKKARDYQEQILQTSKAELTASKLELEKLRDQIAETSKKSEEFELAAALAGYNQMKATIAEQLGKGFPVSDQLLELFGQRLRDPSAEREATKAAQDTSERWDVRVAINLELFKKSSQDRYLDNARLITIENKRAAGSAVASLFSPRFGVFSDQQMRAVVPVMAALILESGFSKEFRDRLLDALSYPSGLNLRVSDLLDMDVLTKLAQFAGARLIETARTNTFPACFSVEQLLRLLAGLSPEAELVYAFRALENAGGGDETDRQCIRNALEKSVKGKPPTGDMLQRWSN